MAEDAFAALRWLSDIGQHSREATGPPPAQSVAELSTGELRYHTLVDQIPAVVFSAVLREGQYDVYVSPQITALLGYSQWEWSSNPVLWYERLHPDDRHMLNREFARGCSTGGPFKSECRFLARDGRTVWVHGEARLVRDRHGVPLLLQGVAFDITEAKRGEELTAAALLEKEASLREKETLLKEIHHRVKNNLQVTSSLLRLQEGRVGDSAAREALRTSRDRIRSMALVHEMLYSSGQLARVDLREYVRVLAGHVLSSHASGPRVALELDLEAATMPLDVVIPSGLILNELIANAVMHAFPEGRLGSIHIGFHRIDSSWELVVSDDGVGLPLGFDPARATSLGLQLVRTLTEQLGGELEIRSHHDGTLVRILFPHRANPGKGS